MKASGKTTSNTIAVLLTIAVLVLAWKMVLPGYFNHKSNLDSLTSEVEAAKIKLESIEKSKSELSAIKPITDQLLIAVPKGVDEPDLISELEAIALKNSIVLPAISISVEEANSETGTETVTANAAAPATVNSATSTANTADTDSTAAETVSSSGKPILVSFAVTGSFANLNSFITGLEKSIRFMNIIGINYGVDTETGENTLALQIDAYQR